MSSSLIPRTRSERVAALGLGPGRFRQLYDALCSSEVLARLGLCLALATFLWVLNAGWSPPFKYRLRQTPVRDIQVRVEFSLPDAKATEAARRDARREVVCVYNHDAKPLEQMQEALKDDVFRVLRSASADAMGEETTTRFLPRGEAEGTAKGDYTPASIFALFRESLAEDQDLARFTAAIKRALAEVENNGILVNLDLKHREVSARLDEIDILPSDPVRRHVVPVDAVRLESVRSRLLPQLEAELRQEKLAVELATPLYFWLAPQLPTTLAFNPNETVAKADGAEKAVEPRSVVYLKGEDIAKGGQPLTPDLLKLLEHEHLAFQSSLNWDDRLGYSLAYFGMCLALYVLCGYYIYWRERKLLTQWRRIVTVLALVAVTASLYRVAEGPGWSPDVNWSAELVPMLLFGMTVAIVYRQELALLLTATTSLLVVLSRGQVLNQFVLVVAAAATCVLLMGRIRSRTRLLYVGTIAGVVAAATCLGVGTLMEQPVFESLGPLAVWYAFCGLLAGLLMTGLLPFVERVFDVQTDISLLELGDAAHPLLQELVRRAPGTYNHSINVASISEAAAEAIGANGLLCRVGAYFHDIGKMLKPGYFIENQGGDASRHESLVPTMSTLVIIAHVKDGADLARQHHLPESIIDFIEQHHGTTLVEYFYNQANRQSRLEDPESDPVDESSFRYPGPKPQSREAAALMLSDAVEGASRTLIDPTPARIENLVHEILMKRLLDGQFDECAITLRELQIMEQSLVKTLTAVYHGRVKYPSQLTA